MGEAIFDAAVGRMDAGCTTASCRGFEVTPVHVVHKCFHWGSMEKGRQAQRIGMHGSGGMERIGRSNEQHTLWNSGRLIRLGRERETLSPRPRPRLLSIYVNVTISASAPSAPALDSQKLELS